MAKYYYLVDIPKIRQDRPMACWYASARMVFNAFAFGPSFGMGQESGALFEEGLSNGRYREFAGKQGLRCMNDSEDDLMDRAKSHSKNYPGLTFQSLVYMLDTYGPLWVVIYQGKHAVVIVGVHEADGGAQSVSYNDPADGLEKRMPLEELNRTVQWESEGVILHYPKNQPTRRAVLSIQLGVWPFNKGP